MSVYRSHTTTRLDSYMSAVKADNKKEITVLETAPKRENKEYLLVETSKNKISLSA